MEHKQLFFCLLAGALSVYSGFNLTHSSLNFGTLALYLLTLAVLARAVFYAQLDRFFATLPGHITLGVLGLGAAFAAFVLGFILWNAYGCAPTGQEKAVVVLGAGLRGDRPSRLLRERLDKAYAYYCENPDLTIVVTGGQGRNELRPEGAAMRDYLVARGVPEQQIISEEKSTSTEENFAFSRQLMEQASLCAEEPILLVTNDFHCYRAKQYAAMAGFAKVTALAAPTPFTAIIPCYLREVAALVYYWLFRSSRTGFLHPLVGILSAGKSLFYYR